MTDKALAERLRKLAQAYRSVLVVDVTSINEATDLERAADLIEQMSEWKVVPVEPTSKMVAAYSAAAEDLIKRHLLSGSYPATWQPIEAGYTAMLAAAPKPGDSNE
jgi:hypothetical protein